MKKNLLSASSSDGTVVGIAVVSNDSTLKYLVDWRTFLGPGFLERERSKWTVEQTKIGRSTKDGGL